MNSLADEFLAFPPDQRRAVHFHLCERALQKWNEYISHQRQIHYVESVVGTRQEVDKLLPADAFESAKQGRDLRNIHGRYLEPITALQDEDLAFPEHVQMAYYALYNLFRKYVQEAAIDDWLIVNQALASEEDAQMWKAVLVDALQRVNPSG